MPGRDRPLRYVRRHVGLSSSTWVALWCALVAATAWAADGPTIRVLLAETAQPATVHLEGAHVVTTVRGSTTATTSLVWPLASRPGTVTVDGRGAGSRIEFDPAAGTFTLNGRTYRGSLRVEATDSGLRFVNLVPLEAYLRGVVPSEMQAIWPMEALKAQAVAARSFTLSRLDPLAPWDVCATEQCQVYLGVAAEHPRSDRAVEDTAGIVITYAERPAAAYYHADSGGTVASSGEVWGTQLPYLVAIPDLTYSTPHRRWTVALSATVLASAAAARGGRIGTPTAVQVVERGPSGRVTRLSVTGSSGTLVFEGSDLASVLRSAGAPSTAFDVVQGLTVRGDGRGHGVGMSQYGARAMAEAGADYREILGFYYRGIGLQRRIYAADAP